jgi:AraC-like DNA-binding protein
MMNMIKKYKEGMDKLSPVVRKKLADLMEKYPNFTVGQLKQIKVPVLVVVGDRDAINIDHCYRVERTSSRAGVSPAEVQRLSRRTVTPTIDLATVPNRVHGRNSIVVLFLCRGTTVLMLY